MASSPGERNRHGLYDRAVRRIKRSERRQASSDDAVLQGAATISRRVEHCGESVLDQADDDISRVTRHARGRLDPNLRPYFCRSARQHKEANSGLWQGGGL